MTCDLVAAQQLAATLFQSQGSDQNVMRFSGSFQECRISNLHLANKWNLVEIRTRFLRSENKRSNL